MGEIRDFVMSEPMCDCHEHQNGFEALERRREELTFQEFLGYAGADMLTAAGVESIPSPLHELPQERFFQLWDAVRTTGYGQATELACRAVTGLEFNQGNAEAVTDKLRAFASEKNGREIYQAMHELAGTPWVINDACWECPTAIEMFTGQKHPDSYRQMLRYDALLTMKKRHQVESWENALDAPLQSLQDIDDALDNYTDKARQGGKLGGLKCGLPYERRIEFAGSSRADAERAFEHMMQGREGDLTPLHDYLFHRFVQRAREFDLPVQFHTGYLAGNWGDFRRGEPMLLIPVFQRYRKVRFDIFHAGWPYSEAAGAIGKAFPNVHLNMCWAWSMSPVQMQRTLDEWLSCVPSNRIFAFGGDTGSPFPMVGYALQAREGIARVLEHKVEREGWDPETARQVARRIMHINPRRLYGLE